MKFIFDVNKWPISENDPVFYSNASHDGMVDGDVVTLTCSVSLRDYLVYSISIQDMIGNSLNYSNGTLVTSESTVLVPNEHKVHSISAEYSVYASSTTPETFGWSIQFVDATEDSPDIGTLFYNRTLYTSLNVTCKFNRYCLDTYIYSIQLL